MPKIFFVGVSGYYYSGSSAIVDLLREFRTFRDFGVEFRLIKDPYGLIDLENNLVINWRDQLNCDIAIKDFIWFCKKLNQVGRRFLSDGSGYSLLLHNFLPQTYHYVASLTEFKFRGRWYFISFRENYFQQLINRQLNKLKLKAGLASMYYTITEKRDFIRKTRDYISSLFLDFSEKGMYKIILDQAIPTTNAKMALDYFDSIKLIVVDRDPRDIFADIIINKPTSFLGERITIEQDAEIFVKDFLLRRRAKSDLLNDKRILCITFEDLIMNYDCTLNKICDFLNIDKSSHTKKKAYFDPSLSMKNIGLWKNVLSKDSINKIEKELVDYLYQK